MAGPDPSEPLDLGDMFFRAPFDTLPDWALRRLNGTAPASNAVGAEREPLRITVSPGAVDVTAWVIGGAVALGLVLIVSRD